MTAPDHGIVLWTLIVAAISTAIALAAAIIAFLTARYAKGAIAPLDETVKRLEEVAKLQNASIQATERMHKQEKLLREIETCGKALDTLLSIPQIGERAATEAKGDPAVMSMRQNAMFRDARRQLLGAIYQLSVKLLPETERVTKLPGFTGSEPQVEAAQ